MANCLGDHNKEGEGEEIPLFPGCSLSKFKCHRPQIPSFMLEGEVFDAWCDDTGATARDTLLRIDESGIFLIWQWQSPNKETGLIDLSQVSDVRHGSAPKDKNFNWELELALQGSLEYRTVLVCSGTDFVHNAIGTSFAANDEKSAKKWIEGLHEICFSHWTRMTAHGSLLWQIYKLWTRIRLSVDGDGRLRVKTLLKWLGCNNSPTFDRTTLETGKFNFFF